MTAQVVRSDRRYEGTILGNVKCFLLDGDWRYADTGDLVEDDDRNDALDLALEPLL